MEKIGNLISPEKKKELYNKFQGKESDNFMGEEKPSSNFLGGLFGPKEDEYKTFMQTRAGQFLAENKEGIGSTLLGLLGKKPAAPTPNYTPAENKGMPTWAWVVIALLVVLIIFFVVRSLRSGK